MSQKSPIIEIENVHVLFKNTCALDVEDLRVYPGERLFILGPSGSGKTTLARLIKGRLGTSTGQVRVLGSPPVTPQTANGKPLLQWRSARRRLERRVAMIDQEFFLVPRLSVVENVLHGALGRVSWGRSLVGYYPPQEWENAAAILREVGLEGKSHARVETLSGGQRQRAAIARALMQEAEIIVADEPISNLDPELAEDALRLLVQCVDRRGVTLLVNLHQPTLARQFASRLLGLSEGKVVYDGPPESFTQDEASFLYRENGQGTRSRKDPNDEQNRLTLDHGEGPAPTVAAENRRPDLRLVRG